MNNKNLFGRLRIGNEGMSPILIVVIVLGVLLVGGGIFGYFMYTRDPFILVYRSNLNMQNSEKLKSFEISGEMSGRINFAKLIKNSESYKSGSDEMSDQIVKDLDTDSTFRFGTKFLSDEGKENLLNFYVKSEGFKFGEFQDFTDSEGNLLDMDFYIKGDLEKTTDVEKMAFRFNKLPNYIPVPAQLSGTEQKISFKPLLGTWVDLTPIAKSTENRGTSSSTTSTTLNTEVENSLLTCDYKDLNFIDRVRAASAFRGMFSSVSNAGQVDLEGEKATKLDFEMVAADRSKIIDAMDSLSKIVCKDTEDLRNDEIINPIFREANVSKITFSYFIDDKNGFLRRTVLSVQFDEKKLGTNFELKGEFNLKNINTTKIEEPRNVKSIEQFLMEDLSSLQSQLMGGSSMPQMQQNSMSGMCPLPASQLAEVMAACNSSSSTLGFKNRSGYCTCYWQTYQMTACNDENGRFQKLQANCSQFVR